ncbi:MAG: PhoX family phosphatase [Steroidobacteraceae bacterium]
MNAGQSGPSVMTNPYIGSVIEQRLSRRELLQSALLTTALPFTSWSAEATAGGLNFKAIAGSKEDRIIVAPGYTHDVVIRWGDSLNTQVPNMDAAGVPKGSLFAPKAAQQQLQQFGSNCDAIQFFQLNAGNKSTQGVLCVNNEYVNDWLMFPGRKMVFGTDPQHVREQIGRYPSIVAMSKAAHGISLVEVQKSASSKWGYSKSSKHNRRVTADTPFEIKGPARGNAWMQTKADPTGTRVLGTFGNCAGGRTPWGTYLSAEENIQDYFGNFAALYGDANVPAAIKLAHRRWRMWSDTSAYGWDVVDKRFDAATEPNEAFRFGWIVEVDPLDASRTPVKRTALGRFAHESASPIVAGNGQLAVYMGDDDKFEYVYKFVSNKRFDAKQPQANGDLLDEGTLYAARFDATGRGEWLPLVYDPKGPLNESNGFRNQAEVLIKARAAADVLGATMMDRPEDVEPNPLTGKVYIACTRNESRTDVSRQGTYGNRSIDIGPNPANPRGRNLWGHIIEISEDGGDHTARKFQWEVMLMGGDPANGRLLSQQAALKPGEVTDKHSYYGGQRDAKQLSGLGSPDNIGFDSAGNLWMVTDGDQPQGGNNGCFACATSGAERGLVKQFMSGPVGAEICGCIFTPDNETLFLSIQHPGENSTVADPNSHWPDGGNSTPRSSVIAIRKEGGGVVGS